jgi:D-threo-aldose 1-dehydrogenase
MATTSHFAPPGPLGFGGAPLGNMFEEVSDATADATLIAAWDEGIRYFDTAPHYGSGISEHRFGHALRSYPRDQFVLSTKVGRLLVPDEVNGGKLGIFVSGLPFRGVYDYSADGARRSIEDSLQRLGMARIDVVYIHDIAEDTHKEGWHELFHTAMTGAAAALTRLREEGVIRAWGLGVNRIEPCLLALEQADPDVFLLAGRYSLMEQPALAELFPRCAERNIHVVVGGPYNSGLIAGGRNFDYQEASPDQSCCARPPS